MLRALIVTPLYPDPDNWQAGIFIHRQILQLQRQNVECRVLYYRPASPRFPRWLIRRTWVRHYWNHIGWTGQFEGVPVELVFYPRAWTADEDVIPNIGASLVNYVAARPELQQTDVVYAHFLWTAGAASLALKERFGWPVAAIARGSEMHNWHKVHPYCRDYVARVIREVDRPLANCHNLRERATEMVPDAVARMGVIYNGCDAERFRPAANKKEVRQALGLPADARLFVFCGTVEERKGVPELTTAWHEFSAAHPEWRLVMVGPAPYPNLMQELQAHNPDRVFFTGRVTPEKVLSYLQAADAYVQPSRAEGLSNATMEAAAVGLPVITTDTHGQREIIQNGVNGWLVPTENPQALLEAMNELADNPARAAQFGEAARATIQRNFNPLREARKLREILYQLSTGKSAVENTLCHC